MRIVFITSMLLICIGLVFVQAIKVVDGWDRDRIVAVQNKNN